VAPGIVDSRESIFDYEYLREFEAKIAKALAEKKRYHCHVLVKCSYTAACIYIQAIK
jgi:hypothetical protein